MHALYVIFHLQLFFCWKSLKCRDRRLHLFWARLCWLTPIMCIFLSLSSSGTSWMLHQYMVSLGRISTYKHDEKPSLMTSSDVINFKVVINLLYTILDKLLKIQSQLWTRTIFTQRTTIWNMYVTKSLVKRFQKGLTCY